MHARSVFTSTSRDVLDLGSEREGTLTKDSSELSAQDQRRVWPGSGPTVPGRVPTPGSLRRGCLSPVGLHRSWL